MIAAAAVEGIAKYVLSADMICQIYNNLIIKSKFGLMNVVIFHQGKQLAGCADNAAGGRSLLETSYLVI
jgi:hypothetical protein